MSEWQEFTAKTVDEALTNAVVSMQTSSDQLEFFGQGVPINGNAGKH